MNGRRGLDLYEGRRATRARRPQFTAPRPLRLCGDFLFLSLAGRYERYSAVASKCSTRAQTPRPTLPMHSSSP